MNTTKTVSDLVNHFATSNGIHHLNYKIRFDSKLNRVAACQKTYAHFSEGQYRPESSQFTFFFSEKFLSHLSREELIDTVIHEVAHALTSPCEASHGSVWRSNAQMMGGTGERSHKSTEAQNEAIKKYKGICPNGHVMYRNRLTKNAKDGSCPNCSDKYDPRFRYEWTTLR